MRIAKPSKHEGFDARRREFPPGRVRCAQKLIHRMVAEKRI